MKGVGSFRRKVILVQFWEFHCGQNALALKAFAFPNFSVSNQAISTSQAKSSVRRWKLCTGLILPLYVGLHSLIVLSAWSIINKIPLRKGCQAINPLKKVISEAKNIDRYRIVSNKKKQIGIDLVSNEIKRYHYPNWPLYWKDTGWFFWLFRPKND